MHRASREDTAATGPGSVPIARVDFDNLTPDYPSYRPVELLVVLAQELRGYHGGPASDRLLEQFLIAAQGVQAASSDRQLEWDDPAILDSIDAFTDYLNTLPTPQILVLDTCEELEKLRPTGSDAPAVERTFTLLERIAGRCPCLRVVLAGRRYLASAGAGWELPESVKQASVASQAARQYLQLLHVRGFNKTDAVDFLTAPREGDEAGTRPSDSLVEAILGQSPEIGSEGLPPSADRYNPFLLGHYRAWWTDEPDLSAKTIEASGTDSYIEGRILSRLGDPDVEDLLPAFVVLRGQLDARVIEHWFGQLDEERVGRVIERLAEQEWVELSTMPVSGTLSLTVSRGLWPLLQAWFRKEPNNSRVEAAARRLSGHLAGRLAKDELGSLTAELVMAALQTQEASDRPALWSNLEARIAESGRWDWASAVLARVRGELREELDLDPVLNATVLATEIAAAARRGGPSSTTPAWFQVAAMLDSADDEAARSPGAQLLRRRAAIWTGPATHAGAAGVRNLLAAMGSSEEPFESVVGALESLLAPLSPPARLELGLFKEGRQAAVDVVRLGSASRPLAAAALVAVASLLPYDERGELLERAATLARAGSGGPRCWADRPLFDGRDLQIWVALNQAWAALEYGDETSAKTVSEWRRMATRADRSADRDRLLGCCIELSPLDKLDGGRRLGVLDVAVRTMSSGGPLDALHDFTPSHFVATARYHYRCGRAQQAWVMLEDERQLSVSLSLDDAHVREVEDALVWLGARMRWESFKSSLKWARRRSAGPPPDPYGIRGALLDALRVLSDGEGLYPEELRDRMESTCPRWLCHDLALELDLLATSPRWRGEAVPRAEQMRKRDPATALQLLTAEALKLDRLQQPSTHELDRVREAYADLANRNGWPSWDDLDPRSEPPGSLKEWGTWVARWRALQGTSPKRVELTSAASPEFAGEASERFRMSVESTSSSRPEAAAERPPWYPRWMRTLSSATSSLVLFGLGVVLAFGVVTIVEQLGGPSWLSYAILALTIVAGFAATWFASGRWKQFKARLLRAYAVVVYVARTSDDPHDSGQEAVLVPGLHFGRTAPHQAIHQAHGPSRPEAAHPRPRALTFQRQSPLEREARARQLSFAGGPLPLVVETSLPGFVDDDVMPRIFADDELGFGRCVVIQDAFGPLPAWPGPGVTLIAPDEWLGVLQRSYGAATKERYTTRISVEDLVKGARVAHVLGLTTRTSRGPVIRLESTTGATRARSWGSSFDASSAATLGSPWLTVLQTTPVDGPLARDSRSARLQDTLAREVQQATGGWVLTVPALSTRLAATLWDALGEFAQLSKPRRWHLVRFADAIKAELLALGDTGQVDPWVAEAVARDVLLYGPWQNT